MRERFNASGHISTGSLGRLGQFPKAEEKVMAPCLQNYSLETTTTEDEITEVTNIYNYQNTPENESWAGVLPLKQALYDPELEKDACGVGFAA